MVVLRCKVAIVGEATVGKSAVTQMLHSGGVSFPKNYMMTLGADFCVKEFVIDQETTVEMTLFDIGGQEIYKRNVEQYVDGANAFVLVYDISNKVTFEALGTWVDRIRKMPGNKNLQGALVANKQDFREKSEVSQAQGEIFARNHKLAFFEASALRGTGLMEPFEHLAKLFARSYEERANIAGALK